MAPKPSTRREIVANSLCPDRTTLPRPARPEAVTVGLERWSEAAARSENSEIVDFAAALADDPTGRPLLEAIFGNSPFLTHAMLADPAFVRMLCMNGAESTFEGVLSDLQAAAPPTAETMEVMRQLRLARRRAALCIAMSDITGAWSLDSVIGGLSSFADTALQVACEHVLVDAARLGEIDLADPENPTRNSGYIVLGMGKLGAGELNYSSDVDLIVLFDADMVRYTGRHGVQHGMVRITQNMMRLLDDRTQDGYVFRTDLRLRPDPGSTPLAISTLAAETYYESTGQNWERAAMIKARPVAGDVEAGNAFLEILRPFIWRKSLDFAAIQDIHSIKRQINAHRGGGTIAVGGHNVKLGRGGIREVEFFAQTQQLIWGGRTPTLRQRSTRAALNALVAAERVDRTVADELIDSYGFLRRVEHRLQMVDDQQTHSLPEGEDDLTAFATFMGFDDLAAFSTVLVDALERVGRHYAELFEEEEELSGPGNLVFTGNEDDPDTLETLRAMGFNEPSVVCAAVRNWHHGRYRSVRSTRSRELLTELVPTVLGAFSHTINPDAALLNFNEFLGRLPAGVQLFSLFHANPGLLDLVAEIMGCAPRLADWLSRYPILLDGVLTHSFFERVAERAEMTEELDRALGQQRDFEDVLDITRRWTNDKVFQIGVHMLRDVTDPEAAGRPLADVADTAVAALVAAVEETFAERHGRVPGGAMAVVALGKLGGQELTVGSDLDLLCVYDVPAGVEASDGEKPLMPGLYYARFCQRLINAITAPTGEGKLYEVDMRLRPAGNAGPIATSLEAFVKYQETEAWTWEHMALTRARVVTSSPGLGARIDEAVRRVLTRKRDPETLARDITDMRERIDAEHGTKNPWHVKHVRGGLVDIEFIAQYLQLRYGHDHPEILAQNTTDVLTRAAAAGVVDTSIANELIATMHLWRRVQGILRLSFGAGFDEAEAPEGLRAWLARATATSDFETLKANVVARAKSAYRCYIDLVETSAATGADRTSGNEQEARD